MRQDTERASFRTAFARAGLTILAAVSTAALIGQSSVLAQQAGQPKAQPKQPAPQGQPARPQQGQAPAPSAQAVVYSPWTKLCQKEQAPTGEKTVCSTQMTARLENSQFLAAAMLIEVQGETTKFIRVTLPLGILLPAGARFAVDKDEPVAAPYLLCVSDGCIAQKDVSAEFAVKLKKGQALTLQGNTPAGQIASYQLPLTDFAKANEGPPATPKDLEQERKKFEDELKRKGKERMGTPPQGDRDR